MKKLIILLFCVGITGSAVAWTFMKTATTIGGSGSSSSNPVHVAGDAILGFGGENIQGFGGENILGIGPTQ